MTATDREGRLLEALGLLADTLVADYDVIDLLQVLVDTCSELLEVDAAGLLLADPDTGELDLVASTAESSGLVEAMHLSVVAGPCVDAYREARVVSVPDVALLPDRFAEFRASALDQGFRSVYAIPMRLRTSTIGALNLFREAIGELNAPDRRAAQALTDVTTIGIVHERAVRAADVVQHQLQRALDSRIVIEQAKGVLAHTHDLTMDEAFVRLRSFARSRQRGIAEVARALVDGEIIF